MNSNPENVAKHKHVDLISEKLTAPLLRGLMAIFNDALLFKHAFFIKFVH